MKAKVKKGLGGVKINGVIRNEGETFEVSEDTFMGVNEGDELLEAVGNYGDPALISKIILIIKNIKSLKDLEVFNFEHKLLKGALKMKWGELTENEIKNKKGEIKEPNPKPEPKPKVETKEGIKEIKDEKEEIKDKEPIEAPEMPKDPDMEAEELEEKEEEGEEIIINMDEVSKMKRDDVYKYLRKLEKDLGIKSGIKKSSTIKEIVAAIQKVVDES